MVRGMQKCINNLLRVAICMEVELALDLFDVASPMINHSCTKIIIIIIIKTNRLV